jgi:rhodanese-related sulfurtransferase
MARSSLFQILIAACGLAALGTTFAADPIPISADTAFDAVTQQVIPGTKWPARVALIDIRDPIEYFFSGAAARVKQITLTGPLGREITIDRVDKTRLMYEGKFLQYQVKGRTFLIPVARIKSVVTEALADNIPFWLRTPNGQGWQDKPTTEAAFYDEIDAWVNDQFDIVILYCRTGGRSSSAGQGILTHGLFAADEVYEIDDPQGASGFGGFSGSPYSNVYNGHVGFPGRSTTTQNPPSVSWLDAGLPATTAFKPIGSE